MAPTGRVGPTRTPLCSPTPFPTDWDVTGGSYAHTMRATATCAPGAGRPCAVQPHHGRARARAFIARRWRQLGGDGLQLGLSSTGQHCVVWIRVWGVLAWVYSGLGRQRSEPVRLGGRAGGCARVAHRSSQLRRASPAAATTRSGRLRGRASCDHVCGAHNCRACRFWACSSVDHESAPASANRPSSNSKDLRKYTSGMCG